MTGTVKENELIEKSCGNVFADLGVDDADEMLAKARLAVAILEEIERRGLTQTQAARILDTDQSYISKLRRGNGLRRFTFDRLMDWLTKLDQNVILTVKQKSRNQKNGLIRVSGS